MNKTGNKNKNSTSYKIKSVAVIKKLKLNDKFNEWVVKNPHSKISVVAR